MLRRSGSIEVANSKRWNGSAWQDCEFVRRWNGSAWFDAWVGKYFTTNGIEGGAGTTATASGGVWTANVYSSDSLHAGALLQLFPLNAFETPFTLEIDWEGSISSGIVGFLEVGSFNVNGDYLAGSGIRHTSSFSRITETVTVPTITEQDHFGAHVNLDNVAGYSATLIVYSIKINGVQISIR